MVTITPPKLKDQPKPFFLDVLSARSFAEGGHRKLAHAITRAFKKNMVNPAAYPKEECIDRRKLKRLLAHDRDVVLSIVELESLHAYLATLGLGLTRKPFFTHSSIVQELADLPDATFMLGSRMRREGPELSHWDIQAMAWIQRTVNEYSNTTFDLLEVPRPETGATDSKDGLPEWAGIFDANSKHSVILIGSERSNEATLLALKTMLGLPLRKTPRWSELPFYFVLFDENDSRPVKGSLSRPVGKVPRQYESLSRDAKKGLCWGVIVGDECFVSETATRSEKENAPRTLQDHVRSHGVIAAQRRPDGQIWVVVAGLTGPGSLAAASQLSEISGALPVSGDERSDAILWGVVETVVDTTQMMHGGKADLGEPKFVVEPSLWDPKKQRAIA